MELKLRKQITHFSSNLVLIVPYGIETTKINYSFFIKFVLIVPYGIETIKQVFCQPLQSSVNCTLWN